MIRVVHQPHEVTDVALGLVGVAAGPVAIEDRATVPSGAALAAEAMVYLDRPVEVRVSGGTDGESYLLTTPVTLASGEVREVEVEVACLDGRWAMPDGGAGMLTIAEFVDAVGLPEAIRMTDADGAGRIDRGRLTAALVAAQGQVEAAIGGRYRLPLASAPVALKTAIADLARARLYDHGAPEGVGEAAKDARRLLDRIAAGQAALPGVNQGEAAPSDDGVLVAPGRKAYPDGLLVY